MHSIYEAYARCVHEAKALGITYGHITSVKVNERLRSTWGQCVHDMADGSCEIRIHPSLVDESTPFELLCNTMHHELIHSMPDTNGHDATFKRYARMLNDKYGYNIQTYVSNAARERNQAYQSRFTFFAVCENCGGRYGFEKVTFTVKHPDFYRCSDCRGRLHIYHADGTKYLRKCYVITNIVWERQTPKLPSVINIPCEELGSFTGNDAKFQEAVRAYIARRWSVPVVSFESEGVGEEVWM